MSPVSPFCSTMGCTVFITRYCWRRVCSNSLSPGAAARWNASSSAFFTLSANAETVGSPWLTAVSSGPPVCTRFW